MHDEKAPMTRVPFHPLLVAILPVLSMFAANPGQRSANELTDSLWIVLGAAVVLLLVAAAVYRELRKAALLVSVLLLVWWLQVDDGWIGDWLGQRRVMPVTYLAVLAWGVWLYRRHAPLTGLTGFWAALGAVVPPIITLVVASPGRQAGAAGADPIVAREVKARPDIYYIVFDRYGDGDDRRVRIQERYRGVSGHWGFYVATDGRSNYMKTVLSLASSLNAGYLDEVVKGHEQSANWTPVYQHLWHHRVGAFLRIGATPTHLGSWYYPTRENPQATRNVNYYTTVPSGLRLFDSKTFAPVQRAFGPWLDDRLQNWHRVRQLDDMAALVPTPGPSSCSCTSSCRIRPTCSTGTAPTSRRRRSGSGRNWRTTPTRCGRPTA